jgi:serine phosphatase RsbU (regulator of sigma subunit)/ligand-binding sensor domain-containing protein
MNMKKNSPSLLSSCKIFLVTWFFFLSSTASAKVIDPQFLSVADGLTSNNISSVFQDSYGLMWIGTFEGLHVYNGYTIELLKHIPGETSSIQNNVIRRITEDEERNIWIGNDLGVSKYDRKRNRFVNYNLLEKYGGSADSHFRAINIFFDSNNKLWITTDNAGLFIHDPAKNSWSYADNLLNGTRVPMLNSFVLGITEDSNGIIWIGDADYGLLFYDSKDSVFVPATFNKQESAVDFTRIENQITSLYADPSDIMWIAARNGVYKFNPGQNKLKTIVEYDYLKLDWYNLWNHIMPDDQGNIWIGNNFRGLLRFDGISDDYQEITFSGHNKSPEAKSDISITLNMVDKSGILWFGTTSYGLIKYDPNDKPFIHYSHDETNKASISNNQIFALEESNILDGKIYVGTVGGGLDLFDQNKKTFSHINFSDVNEVAGLSVRSIVEEDNGSLWLGTWGNGLLETNSEYRVIRHYKNDSLSFNSLVDNFVRAIRKDGNANLWIGTRKGLNFLNTKTKTLKRIGTTAKALYPQELLDIATNLIEPNNPKSSIAKVSNNQDVIKPFEVIKPGDFLVECSGEGGPTANTMVDYGFLLNAENDTIWSSRYSRNSFYAGGDRKNRINLDVLHLMPGTYNLRYISDDSHSYNNWNTPPPIYPEIWGIHLVELENNAQTASIQKYINRAKNQLLITGENIKSISISDKDVWVGTTEGLNKINVETNLAKTYIHDENSENTISNNNVQSIYEDKDGILWLATSGGLDRFDPQKEAFKNYSEEDGLPTNLISSILTGIENEIWISTVNGISKMVTDIESGQVTFVNYDIEDGLGGMQFSSGAGLLASNGEYFFGGTHGLNSFTTKKSNHTEPSLIFSDIKVFNKSLKSNSSNGVPAGASLLELEELELSYDQNDLTFEFAAIHYSAPNKNKYAHKLDGYDKDWIYNYKREVSYTNLDPGEYVFSIKGSNRDGLWTASPISIRIKINPPWWFTTWAFIGYGLLFLGIIFAVDRIQRKRLLIKSKEEMKIQQAEHRAETAELKAKAAEAQSRLIQVENERKSKELEEARQLQLSMLPKHVPELPSLEIAVYMNPATEVGGDYYDFHLSSDGTLTVAVGDATGHGMQAGMMVTATKSLFESMGGRMDTIDFMNEANRTIKQMRLETLKMAFTILKIKENRMYASGAGMPSLLIYRRVSKSLDEMNFEGMPLGSLANFPYEEKQVELSSGDKIVIMSDGFPERQNPSGNMLEYAAAHDAILKSANKSPQEIVDHLIKKGDNWASGRSQDDDVTFVVIEVK